MPISMKPDEQAQRFADDFFTVAPRYRTKARLITQITEYIWLVRQIPWIISFAASHTKPDAAHQKEMEKIMEKTLALLEKKP